MVICSVTNGQAGGNLIETFDYGLVLLDVMLPKLGRVSLYRQIRSKGLQMPILLLTRRDSGHDKAIGLDAGADACWSSLPILFLIAHTDADNMNQVFSVGAEDFVSKPIVGPELVMRIINRLERIRLLRQLAKATQSSLNTPTE